MRTGALLVLAWLVTIGLFVLFGFVDQFRDPVETFWLGMAAGISTGSTLVVFGQRLRRDG